MGFFARAAVNITCLIMSSHGLAAPPCGPWGMAFGMMEVRQTERGISAEALTATSLLKIAGMRVGDTLLALNGIPVIHICDVEVAAARVAASRDGELATHDTWVFTALRSDRLRDFAATGCGLIPPFDDCGANLFRE